MSEETKSESAEANVPFLERPVTRRSVLAAMVVTLPMVAPFSLNAQAGTDGHGCRTGYAWCAACSLCLSTTQGSNNCKCNQGGPNNGCLTSNSAQCWQPAVSGKIQSNLQGESSLQGSPFQQGQSGLTDGGFNSNPW